MTSEVSDERLTLEAILFSFFTRKYVQEADERQKGLGLTYTSVETHDLAKEVANFIISREEWSRRAKAQQEPGDAGRWFDLTGDARLGECATDGCGSQPTMRLEAGGVGANYCSGCADKIQRYATPKPLPAGTMTEGLAARIRLQRHRIYNRINSRQKDKDRWPLGDDDAKELRAINTLLAEIHAAFAARPASAPGLVEALRKIRDVKPDVSAERFRFFATVIADEALSSITETGGAK